MTTSSVSDIERAKELLARLGKRPWTPEHRGVADAAGYPVVVDVGLHGDHEDAQEFIAVAPDAIEALAAALEQAQARVRELERENARWKEEAESETPDELSAKLELAFDGEALLRVKIAQAERDKAALAAGVQAYRRRIVASEGVILCEVSNKFATREEVDEFNAAIRNYEAWEREFGHLSPPWKCIRCGAKNLVGQHCIGCGKAPASAAGDVLRQDGEAGNGQESRPEWRRVFNDLLKRANAEQGNETAQSRVKELEQQNADLAKTVSTLRACLKASPTKSEFARMREGLRLCLDYIYPTGAVNLDAIDAWIRTSIPAEQHREQDAFAITDSGAFESAPARTLPAGKWLLGDGTIVEGPTVLREQDKNDAG